MKLSGGVISELRAEEFAWPEGDRPGELKFWHEVAVEVREAITQALDSSLAPGGIQGARLYGLSSSDEPVGRYQLIIPGGSWFVRVSSRFGYPKLEQAITRYLVDYGVNVNPLIVAGKTLEWKGRPFRVDARPMVDGRHFNGSSDDLGNLASALATCHQALKGFPMVSEIRGIASARYKRLERIKERIRDAIGDGSFELFAERADWASEHRDWLAEMTECFTPDLAQYSGAQCVHGEVHPGNVLFRADDGEAVLVDFEETIHLFAPPAWDLAFLVQRFCLSDYPTKKTVDHRITVITEAYRSPLPSLVDMMRQAAWFTVVTQLDLQLSEGVVSPVSEYDKFVELERQARCYPIV